MQNNDESHALMIVNHEIMVMREYVAKKIGEQFFSRYSPWSEDWVEIYENCGGHIP